MHWKIKLAIAGLLTVSGLSGLAAPARADLDDALREIGRSVRREIEDERNDRVREAVCRRAEGDFRDICRAADELDEIGDEIRDDVNRARILEELFD